MNDLLNLYLTKFEAVVDLDHQRQARETCRRVFEFEPVNELPYVSIEGGEKLDNDWPDFPYNETFVDPAKMLLSQLRTPFIHNQIRDYHPLNIRCNYGTVILPSVFGVGYQLTEMSLPWVHHLRSRHEVERLVARGMPELESGLGGRCFDTLHFYQDTLSGYPRLTEAISIYHPDMQGPFDVAHLIWGCGPPDLGTGYPVCAVRLS
jgi:hypothetical protein